MSYVEIYAVRPNGNIERYGEAHNAWGGAMHIWVALASKYKTGGDLIQGFKTLWRSIGQMEESDQWTLASTFDQCIIQKEYLPTLIKHLNTFLCETAWHGTLAQEIEVLKRANEDVNVQGVCFNQTSVNTNPWYIYSDESEEDGEDGRVYNINNDTNHWFLTPEYLAQ